MADGCWECSECTFQHYAPEHRDFLVCAICASPRGHQTEGGAARQDAFQQRCEKRRAPPPSASANATTAIASTVQSCGGMGGAACTATDPPAKSRSNGVVDAFQLMAEARRKRSRPEQPPPPSPSTQQHSQQSQQSQQPQQPAPVRPREHPVLKGQYTVLNFVTEDCPDCRVFVTSRFSDVVKSEIKIPLGILRSSFV